MQTTKTMKTTWLCVPLSVKAFLPGLMGAMILLSGHNAMAATYFSDATANNPTLLTSWTNSVGVNPPDFVSGDTFIILSGHTYTMPAATTWTVNGTGTGSSATLQINSGGFLAFDLSGGGPVIQLG